MGKKRSPQGHPANRERNPGGHRRRRVATASAPNGAGPRTIFHAADHKEPALDPRLQLTASSLAQLKAQRDHLVEMQAQIRRGEHVDVAALTAAMNTSVAVHSEAYAQLPTAKARVDAFVNHLPAELRRIRLGYVEASRHDPDAGKLEIVEIDGSVKRGGRLGYFQASLVDGTWGALQRRPDDCLQAAIATFLQAPAHTVPDLKLGELRGAGKDPELIDRVIGKRLGGWIEEKAVRLVVHPTRLPTSSRRWIGVVDDGEDSNNSHCVLMQGHEVIFDTAWLVPPRKDEPLSWHSYDDVSLGITIDRR
jgi:hypothetical protein